MFWEINVNNKMNLIKNNSMYNLLCVIQLLISSCNSTEYSNPSQLTTCREFLTLISEDKYNSAFYLTDIDSLDFFSESNQLLNLNLAKSLITKYGLPNENQITVDKLVLDGKLTEYVVYFPDTILATIEAYIVFTFHSDSIKISNIGTYFFNKESNHNLNNLIYNDFQSYETSYLTSYFVYRFANSSKMSENIQSFSGGIKDLNDVRVKQIFDSICTEIINLDNKVVQNSLYDEYIIKDPDYLSLDLYFEFAGQNSVITIQKKICDKGENGISVDRILLIINYDSYMTIKTND